MIDVSRETQERLRAFVSLVVEENSRQNLIAASTLSSMWERHVEDALQLLPLASPGTWLDIGTGGGFPGMVVAIARPEPMLLVEPRVRRASFLSEAVRTLGLHNVEVRQARIEAMAPVGADVISARAVAPLDRLLALSLQHAAPGCTWLLPKGRSAPEELAEARRSWQGDFTLVPSQTDPEAAIVMARNLRHLSRTGR